MRKSKFDLDSSRFSADREPAGSTFHVQKVLPECYSGCEMFPIARFSSPNDLIVVVVALHIVCRTMPESSASPGTRYRGNGAILFPLIAGPLPPPLPPTGVFPAASRRRGSANARSGLAERDRTGPTVRRHRHPTGNRVRPLARRHRQNMRFPSWNPHYFESSSDHLFRSLQLPTPENQGFFRSQGGGVSAVSASPRLALTFGAPHSGRRKALRPAPGR